MESRARGTGHRGAGTGILECRARGYGELTRRTWHRGVPGRRGRGAGSSPRFSAALEWGAAAPAGWLLHRCLGAGPAQPVWPLPAQGGSGGPGAHLGSPRPPRAWLRARPLPGASGKCEEPPPLRGCQGKHGPAQTLCQWAGGPRRDTALGPRTGPLRQAPVPGTCRRASVSHPLRSRQLRPSDRAPASPWRITARQARGFRGAEGGTRGTTSPSARLPPTPGSIAPRPSPRATVRQSRCALPLPAAVLAVSLSPCFPRGDADGAAALTSLGGAKTGAGRGPRAQPGRRRGRKDRVVIAARGSCLQRALLVPGDEPRGRHRYAQGHGGSWCRWHRLFRLRTADTTRAIRDPLGCTCSGLPHAARTVEGPPGPGT